MESKSIAILITSQKNKNVTVQYFINKYSNAYVKLKGIVLALCENVQYLCYSTYYIVIIYYITMEEPINYAANKIAKKVGYLARTRQT